MQFERYDDLESKEGSVGLRCGYDAFQGISDGDVLYKHVTCGARSLLPGP